MIALAVLGGLAAVVGGADLLVRGAARIAAGFGIPNLVVGLTIVAYGTSAPELAVSVGAARAGSPDLAVANVVGSNVFNVLVILGICAVIAPLVVEQRLVRREIPVMVAVTVAFVALASDGAVAAIEGAALLAAMVTLTVLTLRARPKDRPTGARAPTSAGALLRDGALILGGLTLLVVGARWLVDGASGAAAALGVDELVIGLTILAAGTSLPELATSIVALLRGQRDLAIGNVVGSNVFNLLAIVGTATVLAPGGLRVEHQVLSLDAWVMLAAALVLLPMAISGGAIVRWEGAVLLIGYGAYTVLLVAIAIGTVPLPPTVATVAVLSLPVLAMTLAARRRRPQGPASPRGT